jgi:hypothetical protein
MGALAACWIAFPLVMLALTLGCGLLTERLAGIRLPGVLLAPTGLAVVVVVAGFFMLSASTARFATAGTVVVSAIGYVVGRNRLRGLPPDWWAGGAAVAVFLVYGAPILLSGHATFAGYIKLDDTSTWLAITDRAMSHGRSMAGLAPSTYEAALSFYLNTGYPLGSFLPWGVGHSLVGQDLLWVFQPYEAFIAAMLALCAYAMIRPLARRPFAATAAFVGAQAALLYGYSLWGGVKEMMAAFLIALVAALAGWSLHEGPRAFRRPFPLAIAAAATLISLSLGGGAWIFAALFGTLLVLALPRPDWSALGRATLAFAITGAIFAIPAYISARTFLRGAAGLEAKSVAGTTEELGNLLRPLQVRQIAGVWLAGDFRVDPSHGTATAVLITIVVIAAVLGVGYAAFHRSWGLPLFAATAYLGCAVIAYYGSPWVDGKALATASPAVLVAAAAAAAVLVDRADPKRLPLFALSALPLAAMLVGVLWSNTLQYHDVNLAPRDQLRELQYVGDRFAGQGPALMTDYQTYGVRHFLRRLDPEGASELRRRVIPLRADPGGLPKGGFADIDEFAPGALDPYRTLVLRRTPTASRPPSNFQLAWRGTFYEVWQRNDAPAPIEHFPLGNSVSPSAPAPCDQVRRLARVAGPGGRLATVFRAPVAVVPLSAFNHPPEWTDPSGSDVLAKDAGSAQGTIDVNTPGASEVWVGGSFRSKLAVRIDGRPVGAVRDELNNAGGYTPFGSITLAPGTHHVELDYSGPDLAPGSAGVAYPLGPLAIAPGTAPADVSYLPVRDASSLCGKSLDWIEALSAG